MNETPKLTVKTDAGKSEVHFDALPEHVETIEDAYPRGWPKCRCGQPVLEGRSTCGRAECR